MIKSCNTCKKEKSFAEFYTDKTTCSGKRGSCIDCILEQGRTWHKVNRQKSSFNQREWRAKNPTYAREDSLKRKFGITLKQYNELFSIQKGHCAICNKHQNEFKRFLDVDHCHKTGKIRGLLCNSCNKALGMFKDNTTIIDKASVYLKNFKRG